jgi:transmembrane sensor
MNSDGDRHSDRQRAKDTEDAAVWFARWQAGTVDREAFERWRADPANTLAFARVTAAWEAVSEPGEDMAVRAGLTRRGWLRGGVAGAILAAAGSGLIATRAYAWDSASTGVGETRKLRLSDGSMVALNTDTLISWRFSSTLRELRLERGEVAIELQAGPKATLRTDTSSVTLMAGRFNARLRQHRLELMVLRGRAIATNVAPAAGASPATKQVEVQAYQRLDLGEAGPVIQPVSSDAAEAALAWQSGDIVFLDTPLADAVAEYNRYLLRKIVIDDASVGAIRVGGRFISSDPADFLKAVSTSLGVQVRTTATDYRLSR